MRLRFVALAIALLTAFGWGLAVGLYQVFPFEQLRAVKRIVTPPTADADRPKPRATQFDSFSPPSDVVMVGDSITESGLWSEILPSVRVANRGLDGDTTADVLARLDGITATQAQRAFVLLGINDLSGGAEVPDILERYARIVDGLAAAGMQVHVQSVLRCAVPRCARYASRIPDLNRGLQALAASRGLPYIDLNAVLAAPDGGLLDVHTYDGVHLLGSGYAAWAAALQPFVAASRSAPGTMPPATVR